MKTIATAAMLIAASVVAVVLLRSRQRDRRARLVGRLGSHFARAVSIALLALGIANSVPNAKHAVAQVDAAKKRGAIDADLIRKWRHRFRDVDQIKSALVVVSNKQSNVSARKAARRTLAPFRSGQDPMHIVIASDLSNRSVSVDVLRKALAALEVSGNWDTWFAGYLWRRTASLGNRDGLSSLYQAIRRHIRITNTLTRAAARIKAIPFSPRAWMSKAGPSPRVRRQEAKVQSELLAAARTLHSSTDLGPWESESFLDASVIAGEIVRLQDQPQRFRPGARFQFRRLDVIKTGASGARLRHPWLGDILFPPNRTYTVWDIPGLLSVNANKHVASQVSRALAGDLTAAKKLEKSLPAVQQAIRLGVRRDPTAKGAPRLRTLLMLFDG